MEVDPGVHVLGLALGELDETHRQALAVPYATLLNQLTGA